MCVGEISIPAVHLDDAVGQKAKRSLSLGCDASSAPSEEDDDSPSAAAAASTFEARWAPESATSSRRGARQPPPRGRAPRLAAQIVVSTIMGARLFRGERARRAANCAARRSRQRSPRATRLLLRRLSEQLCVRCSGGTHAIFWVRSALRCRRSAASTTRSSRSAARAAATCREQLRAAAARAACARAGGGGRCCCRWAACRRRSCASGGRGGRRR